MALDEVTLPLHVEQQPGQVTHFLRIPSIYVWGYLTSLSARGRIATLLREHVGIMKLDVPLVPATPKVPDENPLPPEGAGPV